MDYLELDVKINPRQPGTDLLITELAELGFESFVETQDGFLAYIPAKEFSEALLSPIQNIKEELGKVSWSKKLIPAQNWNAEWESSYQPIQISDKLLIRAPFHEAVQGVEIDLEIQPQQSFGTGHHPTTRLMAEKLLTMPLAGRYVLDMGCGTGVLAILAAKLGAAGVLGIDIESNAVMNAIENVQRNKVENVTIEEGKDDKTGDRKFDLVLANINKNVLVSALPNYTKALNKNGELLMSGFFTTDVAALKEAAERTGLKFVSKENDGEWALVHFVK
ncbi:MAG: 50S ribosomal protein L11 methyltransferase [Bacteroidota bacterium]|nr:50S ribosomal protein L11 methyltransferase [Bacteroidota bacterium]